MKGQTGYKSVRCRIAMTKCYPLSAAICTLAISYWLNNSIFSVSSAKIAFVFDYTSKFPVSFCRISNISLNLTSLFGGYAHSGYSHLVFNPLINSGCYDLHQAKIGNTNNQA